MFDALLMLCLKLWSTLYLLGLFVLKYLALDLNFILRYALVVVIAREVLKENKIKGII